MPRVTIYGDQVSFLSSPFAHNTYCSFMQSPSSAREIEEVSSILRNAGFNADDITVVQCDPNIAAAFTDKKDDNKGLKVACDGNVIAVVRFFSASVNSSKPVIIIEHLGLISLQGIIDIKKADTGTHTPICGFAAECPMTSQFYADILLVVCLTRLQTAAFARLRRNRRPWHRPRRVGGIRPPHS